MRYILVSCLIAAFGLLSFFAPTGITVAGKVTNENGVAMAAITVKEKGTHSATTTDANGAFSITVTNEKAILVFSGLGYDQQEISLSGHTNLNISMKATTAELSEVLITGNGHTRKQVKLDKSIAVLGYTSAPAATGFMRGRGNVAAGGRNYEKGHGFNKKSDGTRIKDETEYNTEDYDVIVENRFLTVQENALSTFSIDVDAAAYSNVRRYLQMGQLPPAGAVRLEEMINYFHYDYPQPQSDAPFSINTEIADCPWNTAHRLVLVGLQGKKIPVENLPASNIVFLIDVSGSMMDENKLPLVKASMKLLVDQLREQDKISLVVYAGNAGLVLPATSGANKSVIKAAIDKLEAGGSTAGGEGIQLAYKTAKENYMKSGNNRIILCTDGDFNVGASSDDALVHMVEEERKSGVFLTVLGYGMGNYKDNKMEKLADKGNGNHAYIDGLNEARKVLVNEFGGTLFTIAKDVKLQLEFNPAKVQAYRLIGYENRLLNKEDFNNDKKDAGELGSGHTVTALYEVIPAGAKNEFLEDIDKLKYQQQKPIVASAGNELMTIKFRYKQPDGDISKLIEHAVADHQQRSEQASENFRFAAAVAEFGMLLRHSEFKQSASFNNAWQLAKHALGKDQEGYRSEFLTLLKNAQSIARKEKTAVPEEDEDDNKVSARLK